MFFVSRTSRIQPYYRGKEWRSKEALEGFEKLRDKEHDEEQREHPQDDFHLENLEEYIKPLKESSRKLHATVIARSVMSTPVITVSKDMSLKEARETFAKHRFSSLPVVAEGGELLGILSDRELYEEQHNPDKKVGEVMTEEVLCADESTDVDLLAEVLFEEKIKFVPVIDEKKKVVGIVTRNDILRTVLKINALRFKG